MAYWYLVVGLAYQLEMITKDQYDKLNKLAVKGVLPDQPDAILEIIKDVLKEDELSFAKRVRSLESRVRVVEDGVAHNFQEIYDQITTQLKKLESKKKPVSKNVVDIKK
jgi:ATP adenylyltransferase/5',5'''-P-1,P-4-tetraphosphate phosphorylase II